MVKKEGPYFVNDVKEFAYSLFDEYRRLYASFAPQSAQICDNMSLDTHDDDKCKMDMIT